MGAGASSSGRIEKVVILGAGYAGSSLAQLSSSRFQTTLIDRRDVTIHKLAGPRCAMSLDWSHLAAVPIDNIFEQSNPDKGHRVMQAHVVKIDKDTKKLLHADGTTTPYDILVLAMGAESLSPADPPQICVTQKDCEFYFKGIANQVKESKHILIVGGGAVGVEIAGELRHFHPSVKVTMCDSNDSFVKGVSMQLSSDLLKVAQDNNVDVMFNERVKSQAGEGEGIDTTNLLTTKVLKPKDGIVRFQSNRAVENVDLVFWCVGAKPSTGLLSESGMEDKLDERGLIKVNEFLQVEGEKFIYAIGDCNNVKEMKLAAAAGSNAKKPLFPPGQADGAYENILAHSFGRSLVPFKTNYDPPQKLCITFGPHNGVVRGLPSFVLAAKNKSLMLQARWQECNQQPPTLPNV